jgi:hypothetical protein
VADNTNMNDVDFEDVSKEHWEHLGYQWNFQFVGEIYGDNFDKKGNYKYWDHNAELNRDLCIIKLKIPVF